MTVPLQQFLADASRLVIPSGRGLTVIKDILQDMRGVVDFTPQASRIEWDQHLLTATVTSAPQFSVPQTAFNVTTIYHHISVQRLVGAGTDDWFVSVSYPGLSVPIQVLRNSVPEADGMVDLLALNFPGSGQRLIMREARPLILWPRASLIVQRTADILGSQSVRMQYVREIIGAPFSAELVDDITGGFV